MADLTFRAQRSPRASQAGMPIVADTAEMSRLARDLRRASPDAWKSFRVALRAAAEPVKAQAQSNSSFSSRIPASIRVRVTPGGNVKIVAGGEDAPDAAPIENKGKGEVRHPVFGNRDVWTSKNSPPAYLTPAFDAHREIVVRQVEDAVFTAVSRAVGGR